MNKNIIDFTFTYIIIYMYTILVLHISQKQINNNNIYETYQYNFLDFPFIILFSSMLCTLFIILLQNI